MKVLFATAELSPLVSVGGLGEASAGLVRALRDEGIDVQVVIPRYREWDAEIRESVALRVPAWAAPSTAHRGSVDGIGPVTFIEFPGADRPDPYVDHDGNPWHDNADRFFAFSAAIAALADLDRPDVVHCNDWHTAAAMAFYGERHPTLLTIHTLGYQGWTSGGWLDRIPHNPELFEWYGGTNPLAGGIGSADVVVAVSPNYAAEITREETGAGLDGVLRGIGDRLIGIRNGIDTEQWNPRMDDVIAARFDVDDLAGKDLCRSDLEAALGWEASTVPIVGIVSRLVHQKGIDLALDALTYADRVPFRIAMVGSGERSLADRAHRIALERPSVLSFSEVYDPGWARRIFAGSDLFLMPSRFEPCGLAQMQAMTYGALPITTSVGGLVDTVIDVDEFPARGNGVRSLTVDTAGVVDALHRGVRAWRSPRRRAAMIRRGMSHDWSWRSAASEYIAAYERVSARS